MDNKKLSEKKQELMKPDWTENLHHELQELPLQEAKWIVENMTDSEIFSKVNNRRFQEDYIADYIEYLWTISPIAYWKHIIASLSTIKRRNMYEEFLEKSLNSKRQAVDDTFIAKYADLSYPELNTLWQEVGLGSFCNGLFKLINPSDYQDVINSCFEKEDDQSFLPFMCTAFGDLFAYVKNPRLNNYVVYLNVRYGTYLILPANLRAIFNKVMVNESFLKGWFDLENYPIIQEKLGTPDYDECFGYSLLLALGGSEDIENIKIVKTIPYIDICTQTIGEFEIADKW